MPIRALVFDADGVVLIPKRFSEYLAREYDISEAQTADFFYGALEECILGRADLREMLPPFLDRWGWQFGVDQFLAEWFRVGAAVDRRVLDRISMLRGRGLICCLATNQEPYRIEYMRTAMGFALIFDRLLYSAEIGHKKTDPEFYAYAEQELALRGEEILLWDDGVDNVAAARAYGWQAELFVSFEEFARALDARLAVGHPAPDHDE